MIEAAIIAAAVIVGVAILLADVTLNRIARALEKIAKK